MDKYGRPAHVDLGVVNTPKELDGSSTHSRTIPDARCLAGQLENNSAMENPSICWSPNKKLPSGELT